MAQPTQTRSLRAGGDNPPAPAWDRLCLDGLDHIILLPREAALAPALQGCLSGWQSRVIAARPGARPGSAPVSVIAPQAGGTYVAHSPYTDAPIAGLGPAAAICAVLADVTQSYSDQAKGHVFGLHCGGLRLGRSMLVLAGERRAGKSTLVARLSAEAGVSVFADDVLPVTARGEALALGVAPRLRLPLPETASARFRAHVARRLGPADARYGYLHLPDLAPHGTRAPVDAFVLLDRQPAGPARLHRLEPDETVRLILERSISAPDRAEAALAAAEALAQGIRGLRLVYADLEEATALLIAAFAGGGDPAVAVLPPLALQAQLPADTAPLLADRNQTFARSPGTTVRRLGLAAFLWQPGAAELWHLNPVAQGIWSLLEEPGSPAELAALLSEVFPQEPADRLLCDVQGLLARMADNGLIQPQD